MFWLDEFVSGMVMHGTASQPRFCFVRYGELWNGEFRIGKSVTDWLGAVCQVSATRDKPRQLKAVGWWETKSEYWSDGYANYQLLESQYLPC